MDVQTLINMLETIADKSATVTIDGCDCAAEAAAVFVDDDGVTIARPDTLHHYAGSDRVGSEVSA